MAPAPAAAPAKSAWAKAAALNKDSMKELMKASRKEWAEQARQTYEDAIARARKAWEKRDLPKCEEHLSLALLQCPSSDALHRSRAAVRSRLGNAVGVGRCRHLKVGETERVDDRAPHSR